MTKSTLSTLLSLCLVTTGLAKSDHPKSQVEGESLSDSFVFQLLPNSLSKNPRLEMSFITEMTVNGHKLTLPTPKAPTYYLSQQGGYRQLGDSYTGERTPAPEGVQKLMQEALGKAGYLPADADHPATLVVVFHWGSYPALTGISAGGGNFRTHQSNQQILERAILVGGEKFAMELKQAHEEASSLRDAYQPRRVVYGRQIFAESSVRNSYTSSYQPLHSMAETGFGDTSGFMNEAFDPIKVFLRKSTSNQGLYDLAVGGCYFVIASAYDVGAAAHDQKVLLWRTKMCAADNGVSLEDAMTPLIKRSARYLGRYTDGAVNISRRLHEGKVDIGETKVMGTVENPTDLPPPKK